jgi:hypothetical protein
LRHHLSGQGRKSQRRLTTQPLSKSNEVGNDQRLSPHRQNRSVALTAGFQQFHPAADNDKRLFFCGIPGIADTRIEVQ